MDLLCNAAETCSGTQFLPDNYITTLIAVLAIDVVILLVLRNYLGFRILFVPLPTYPTFYTTPGPAECGFLYLRLT